MNAHATHVVLGASGGAGNAIARALHDADIPTRGVNRSGSADLPPAIPVTAADITSDEELADATRGAAVVYLAAQPPYHRWAEEFPPMLDAVIDACTRSGAKLVMVDNLYVYGPVSAPITEATPHRATDRKGIVRRAMFRALMDAHEAGDVRVTIGQASDYFGPRCTNSGIASLALPATDGGSIRWLGSLDTPHSLAYLPDIARAYVALGTSEEADGSAWILPHPAPITGRDFLDLVNTNLEEPRTVARVSKAKLRLAAPFYRAARESLDVAYQWIDPWVTDSTVFESAFGPFTATPIEAAVKDTLDWHLSGHAS